MPASTNASGHLKAIALRIGGVSGRIAAMVRPSAGLVNRRGKDQGK
jgi:hypothetical protein